MFQSNSAFNESEGSTRGVSVVIPDLPKIPHGKLNESEIDLNLKIVAIQASMAEPGSQDLALALAGSLTIDRNVRPGLALEAAILQSNVVFQLSEDPESLKEASAKLLGTIERISRDHSLSPECVEGIRSVAAISILNFAETLKKSGNPSLALQFIENQLSSHPTLPPEIYSQLLLNAFILTEYHFENNKAHRPLARKRLEAAWDILRSDSILVEALPARLLAAKEMARLLFSEGRHDKVAEVISSIDKVADLFPSDDGRNQFLMGILNFLATRMHLQNRDVGSAMARAAQGAIQLQKLEQSDATEYLVSLLSLVAVDQAMRRKDLELANTTSLILETTAKSGDAREALDVTLSQMTEIATSPRNQALLNAIIRVSALTSRPDY